MPVRAGAPTARPSARHSADNTSRVPIVRCIHSQELGIRGASRDISDGNGHWPQGIAARLLVRACTNPFSRQGPNQRPGITCSASGAAQPIFHGLWFGAGHAIGVRQFAPVVIGYDAFVGKRRCEHRIRVVGFAFCQDDKQSSTILLNSKNVVSWKIF